MLTVLLSIPFVAREAFSRETFFTGDFDAKASEYLGEYDGLVRAVGERACSGFQLNSLDQVKTAMNMSDHDSFQLAGLDLKRSGRPSCITWFKKCEEYKTELHGDELAIRLDEHGSVFLQKNGTYILTVSFSEDKNRPCQLKQVIRAYFGKYPRLATRYEMISRIENGYELLGQDGDAPKELKDIYNPCNYKDKSFEEIERISQDTSRIIVSTLEFGHPDLNEPEFAYKILRKYVNDGHVDNLVDAHATTVARVMLEGSDHLAYLPVTGWESNLDLNSPGDMQRLRDKIHYFQKRGVRVVNMSIGLETYVPGRLDAWCSILESAPNILFVVSAGNDSKDINESKIFPANCAIRNRLTVASVNDQGKLSTFSSYGKASVELAARGENIDFRHKNSGTKEEGTSFSAPTVASTAAQMLFINPNLSPQEIIQLLKRSTKKSPELKDKLVFGGELDSAEALRLTKQSLWRNPSSDE